jgi:hypothetical protein
MAPPSSLKFPVFRGCKIMVQTYTEECNQK